jgi:alkylation response protein AidB-like acyl-CoA dehydrogenase
LRPCIAQLVLANVYLGIGQGAFEAARAFTNEQAKPWFLSGVERASEDPYVVRTYGELWTELEAARALTDEAARAFEDAWQRGDALTPDERAAASIAIALAKVKTTRAGLDAASRSFEAMGARATAGKARLDRFWRNLRVHTLHDPVDYKLRDIGAWALRDVPPPPSFYS